MGNVGNPTFSYSDTEQVLQGQPLHPQEQLQAQAQLQSGDSNLPPPKS